MQAQGPQLAGARVLVTSSILGIGRGIATVLRDQGATVAFLASSRARYITGQSITVDGGQILAESPEALEEVHA